MSDRSPAAPAPAVAAQDTVVVALPAEIDAGNDRLVYDALAAALSSGPEVVIADGTETGFCDCAAISALVGARNLAAAAGAQLRVVIASALVHRVLELTGADDLLLVYPSLEAAQAGA